MHRKGEAERFHNKWVARMPNECCYQGSREDKRNSFGLGNCVLVLALLTAKWLVCILNVHYTLCEFLPLDIFHWFVAKHTMLSKSLEQSCQ